MSKDTIRREVWEKMKRQRVALFPGADGRIPNFRGARTAAEHLAQAPEFQNAKILKCNPDAPQLPVRALALAAGKTVFMAVPRLREEKCFIRVTDPRGASIAGASRYGVPVHPREMPPWTSS